MITRRTRIQLAIFVAITLFGVSFVGARYARLDRAFFDDHYTVVAHFAASGGIYTGGEVSYRGVKIGQVGDMRLTDDGVDVHLDIDNGFDRIPADTLAVVGNRSAVGEQYVELQPKSDERPYLDEGAEIPESDTRTPLPTEKLLADVSTTVDSVDQDALRTTVSELGAAFAGTGDELQQLLDTSSDFISTANDNFDVTARLIRDGNTVLRGQVASESAIRSFARDLSLFSGTLAADDPALRRLITNGAAGAAALKTFLDENGVVLTELLRNSVITGDIVYAHLPGLKQVLVLYPYVVEGGFTVTSKDPKTGRYDAHFGLVLTQTSPCHKGYEATRTRPPQQLADQPMNVNAHCAEPASRTNARGAQHLNRAAPAGSEPVADYDAQTGALRWRTGAEPVAGAGTVSPRRDSWTWLYAPTAVGK